MIVNPHSPHPVYAAVRSTCRLGLTTLFGLKAYHKHRVPQTGGVLFVTNHQSFLDPTIVGVLLRRPVAYMARSTLFEVPVFGPLIRRLNAFPVQRGKGDRAAMDLTIRLLQDGWALNVFPEGTRSPDGELQPLQRGVALIARRAGVPVVPTVVEGSHDAWPKGQKLPSPSPVRVIYGEPFDPKPMSSEQFLARVTQEFRSLQTELRQDPDFARHRFADRPNRVSTDKPPSR